MIYLERTHCPHPWCTPGLNLMYGNGHGRRISGCEGVRLSSARMSHRGLPADLRHALQEVVAALIVGGQVSREEGERFLDEVYANNVLALRSCEGAANVDLG